MTRNQKYVLGVVVLLFALVIKLPIWRIDIWAPQYPEGLSLEISADRIDGNVDQINILNHYIGMKRIVPEQIPELKIIPWILAGASLLGILVIVLNRLFLAKIWFVLLCVLSVVGMTDFYLWGYDYGHNLSADAPIKIPGFSYQPPLLGYKKILNIEAYSLPDLGAYVLVLAIILAFLAIYWDTTTRVFKACRVFILKMAGPSPKKLFLIIPLLFTVLSTSCTNEPDPIKIGLDHCGNCHMQIADDRFGGEIITVKGRIYKFDSIQCIREYLSKNSGDADKIFVLDYFDPGVLINTDTAYFLSDSTITGPMGDSTLASKDEAAIKKLKAKASGKVIDWKELLESSL